MEIKIELRCDYCGKPLKSNDVRIRDAAEPGSLTVYVKRCDDLDCIKVRW